MTVDANEVLARVTKASQYLSPRTEMFGIAPSTSRRSSDEAPTQVQRGVQRLFLRRVKAL